MFNFMKKGVNERDREKSDREEKEKRKRDKKLRKEGKQGVAGSMSTEELLRLDEVRRSLKIRGRRKEKEKLPSGITADYSEFFANLDVERSSIELDRGNEEIFAATTTIEHNSSNGSLTSSVSGSDGTNIGNNSGNLKASAFYAPIHYSPNSQNDRIRSCSPTGHTFQSDNPPMGFLHSVNNTKGRFSPLVPPKPPKRGILKGSRSNVSSIHEEVIVTTTDSGAILMENTFHNEMPFVKSRNSYASNENISGKLMIEGQEGKNHLIMNTLHVTTSPSPSAESLTDTTNSSFATPPFSLSPVGESQGFHKWSRVHAFEGVYLPLPPIQLVKLPPPRELTIKRQKYPRNDFGFSLRKAICVDRTESLTTPILKPVIFAEPGTGGGSTGLLPGDRLLKVNGTAVEELSREVIIEMIRNSGDSVTVEVQPVGELVELSRRCMMNFEEPQFEIDKHPINCDTLKRSASKRFKQNAKMKGDVNSADAPSDNDQVWIVHRGGFTAALRLPQNSIECIESGKIAIQFLHNNERILVDESDVEKANSPTLDLVEDICDLKHLNEASVLHCLRQRYASNLIHTKAGQILIVVNPMAPLSLYSEKVVSMFRGCKPEDMPPHIYSLAQTAYRTMLETRRDQSLVFMGRSGSGKTTSFKHALYYLTLAAGSVNKLLTAEKVNAINTILEAFGNTKTRLNSNATRFTQLLSLDFDHSGQIASASVQILLLERQRAGKRTIHNEYTFHIITRLLAGAEGVLQKELCLDNVSTEENNPFVSLPQRLEDRQKASAEFVRTVQAFETLNVHSAEVKGIWCILASIYHLGVAGVTRIGSGPTSRIQFGNPSAARKAASLLGVTLEDLVAAAFPPTPAGGSSPVRSPVDTLDTATDNLEGLVIGLYSEAVAAAAALINKAVYSSARTIASILLVDTPGFQNPASCGVQYGASLADFRHNYLQERLQLLFHHVTLVAPKDRYAQELVEIDIDEFPETNPGPIVSLIDKPPQNHVVRTSQRDLREQDRRGLLWLLDEESMHPNSSDDTLLERIFSHYGDRDHLSLIRRVTGFRQFVLHHLQGTNPVLYSVTGWVNASREQSTVKNALSLVQNSTRDEINRLYIGSVSRSSGNILCGLEGTQSLRRVSSIRRSFPSVGVKRNSVMLQMKFTVDGIIDTLRRTDIKFVHCYLLQHNGGTQSIINSSSNHAINFNAEDIINVPLLRSQIRGSQVLEAARLHRLGFPETVPLSEFVRRFGLLGNSTFEEPAVEQILSMNEIDPSSYRIGPSQVLFRSGILSQLEAKRDELLSDRIIQLQARCRGYLSRQRMAQRRVQELAVRCIQRNVKAFLAVRDWPWWRLLVRVTPLLSVHRTEEQLKLANDELQILRNKLEKIEKDRLLLKTENEKLEAKLSDMAVDLAEERSGSNIATERLEAEMGERIKLEKEVQEQQEKIKNLQESSEKLEMELICAKSDLSGISDEEDPDNDDNGGVYKLKYERVSRELEFTKKRLQTQHEHDLEQLVGLKKQLEKKLADAYEEVEEQRQVVGQWKRKAQKLTNEMNDLRMLLEEHNGRNNLLEKKQRRFDAEYQALQDVLRQEKQAKDRLAREKDVILAEKFTLEQTLSDTRLELELKEEKLVALQREIADMSFGGETEQEVAQLRRSKIDAERKLKEQEEELDEMAGQVQLLEQAKLRLEMTLENMRKEARKEAQQRDEELEEARGSAFKKIKALECQLETEHEERTLLLREKHELERRLQNLEDQDRADRAAEEAVVQKLKKDLRKYRALLKDAQSQLDRLRVETPGKALIRQLRNQLEDTEAARSLAIKSKQSAETELAEVQLMLEETQRAKNDAEEKASSALRDKTELQTQIEENEEEISELMKKYSAAVKQLNNEQMATSEYELKIFELESEKNSLKEQIAELQTRLANIENISDPSAAAQSKRLEMKAKELESRLELEQATRVRLEVQINRHKDALEKIQHELTQSKMKEMQTQEVLKKAQKSLRESREEYHAVFNREQECLTKRKDIEKRLETSEAEVSSLKNDLRLALQRIADLQQAMEEGDNDISESDESGESTDLSLSDLEQRLMPIQVKRSSATTPMKDSSGLSDNNLASKKKEEENNSPSIKVSPVPPNANSNTHESLSNGNTSFA